MKYAITLIAALAVASFSYAQGDYASKSISVGALPSVVLPELPASLDFAGERVPLNNYDTRESLERELLVTCYMHSRTMLTMLNSRRYFPIIEPILVKYGIPADFKYLCVAESGLNPDAVSSAKAGGLWQLMPATGKELGLEVGGEVDERFHIEKSTEAACKYLLKSYERFGSWTAAAAAYNLGDGGVSRRMEKQGLNNYYDIYLPDETRRYVFRILSFKLLFESPSMYGFNVTSGQYYRPLADYREVTVCDKDIDWSKFARDNGTTYKMLRELNHWIRDYQFANKDGRTWTVKVPNAGFRTK